MIEFDILAVFLGSVFTLFMVVAVADWLDG